MRAVAVEENGSGSSVRTPDERSVSVVIITHNRFEYLLEAIESAAGQTLKPLEIIVVDDGSPFGVERRFMAENCVYPDVPLRFARIEDLGPSAARNAGSELAQGVFLALLDDDDLWEPSYLETALERCRSSDCDAAVTWMTCFNEKGRWPGKRLPADFHGIDLYARNHGLVGSNIFIKRSVYQQLGGFDAELLGSEDKDFLIRLANASVPIAIQEDALVLYRVHPGEQASGAGQFSYLQMSGKAKFLKKHAGEMPARTRRVLQADSGFFQLMGGRNLTTRVTGMKNILTSNPLKLIDLLRHLSRRIRQSGAAD